MSDPSFSFQMVPCPGRLDDGSECGTLIPVIASENSKGRCLRCNRARFEYVEEGCVIKAIREIESDDTGSDQ